MSNINKQALREAAEKATPGNWRRASTRFNGITAQGVYPPCGKEEILASAAEKRDAEFIAAANPSTVLALLDELEAAEALNKHLELAIRKAEGCSEALRRKTEAAEKRIAELEAREVVIRQFDEFSICHFGGSEDYAKGYIDCQKNYNKALGAASILVSIKGE